MRGCRRHLTPPFDLGPLLLGKVDLGGKGRCLSAASMAFAIFLLSEKRSVSEGGLLSKMLMDKKSYNFAISWRMASVSLLKMPAASFAPVYESFLIWEFQAATSWGTSSLHVLSSSNSFWEARSKGGRGVLHAELI
jgi:hypothetical protein